MPGEKVERFFFGKRCAIDFFHHMTKKTAHVGSLRSAPKMWKIPTNQYFHVFPKKKHGCFFFVHARNFTKCFFMKPTVADDLQEVNHMMLDHMDTESSTYRDAACRWVKSNRERWRDWRLRYH